MRTGPHPSCSCRHRDRRLRALVVRRVDRRAAGLDDAGRPVAAALRRRRVGLRVVELALLADAARRALPAAVPPRHGVPAALGRGSAPSDYDMPARGTIDFQHTDAGLVNLNYQSTPPPPQFPILCATHDASAPTASRARCSSRSGARARRCWPSRSCAGTRWSAQGGADNDVASDNRYAGREQVVVPAFPSGVDAAKVRSTDHPGGRARRSVRQRRRGRSGGCAASGP